MAETDRDAQTDEQREACRIALERHYGTRGGGRAVVRLSREAFEAGFAAGLSARASVPRGTPGRVEPAIIAAEEGQANSTVVVPVPETAAEAAQRLGAAGFNASQIEALLALSLWGRK